LPRFLPSLTAALAWGAMFPIAAGALDRIDPFHLTAFRYLVATAIFVALLVAIEGRDALRPDGRTLELFLLGTLGFAGFNLLTYVALEHTRPQDAALIVATAPAVTVVATWLVSSVRPRGVQLLLTALALLGVALVISRGNPADLAGGGVGAWELLVLGGVVAWVAYTLGARRFPGFSPLRYTTLTAVGGTLIIVAITQGLTWAGELTAPGGNDLVANWWRLLYVVGPAAVIAVLAWNDGIRRIGPPNGALFMNLVPVVSFAIAVAQGYRPGAVELAGAGLTVAALVAANLAGRRPARGPAQVGTRASGAGWPANAAKSRA
jgi:drug/metabolite transporter (DMT)-like permease